MSVKLKKDLSDIDRQTASLKWTHAVTLLLGLIVAVIVLSGFYKSTLVHNLYMPLIDASMEIKFESTSAHLWMEEVLSGDQSEDPDRIWKQIDRADWYARAMLDGGVNEHGVYLPLQEETMRRNIESVRNKLVLFRDVSEQRLQSRMMSGPGSDIEAYYDAVFDELINHSANVELSLRQLMTSKKKELWYTQLIIICFAGLLGVCIGVIYWRYHHQRLLSMQSLNRAKEDLNREVAEHKEAKITIVEQNEQLEKTLFDLAELRTSDEERLIELNLSNEQLRIAIDEAEISNIAMRRFFESMISEARVQTDAIIEYVNIILDSGITNKLRKNIEPVKKFVYSSLNLFDSFIDLLRIESGDIDFKITDFNIRHGLENIVMTMTPKANKKGLVLECEVDPDVPMNVRGDKVRLWQILMHLVNNAIKFTEKGRVTLKVRSGHSRKSEHTDGTNGKTRVLHFSVSDTGVGIAHDKLITLFDAKTTIDSHNIYQDGELSIGLYIADKLVHKMGGEIWAESHEGKGSTFNVTMMFNVDTDRTDEPAPHEDDSLNEQSAVSSVSDSATERPADLPG